MKKKIEEAFIWFKNNPGIEEVLITGGDFLVLNDEEIDGILKRFDEMSHIKRIRIGTASCLSRNALY